MARALILLLFLVTSAHASGKSEFRGLYDRGRASSSLDNAGPFHLLATIRTDDGKIVGTLQEDHFGKELWRSKTDLDGFSKIVVRNGKQQWKRSNAQFDPFAVRTFWRAIRPFYIEHLPAPDSIKEEKSQSSLCAKWENVSVCLNQTTGAFVKLIADMDTLDYLQYQGFASQQVPEKVEVTDDLGRHFRVDIEISPAPELKESMFSPPAPSDMESEPICEHVKPEKPIAGADARAILSNLRGDAIVLVRVVVTKGGGVVPIEVLRSPDEKFTRAAVDSIKLWKFKPATCNDVPVDRYLTFGIKVHGHL